MIPSVLSLSHPHELPLTQHSFRSTSELAHQVTRHNLVRHMLDRLAVFPSRVRSQVMSPTTPWRSSARRTRLRTQHQEEHVSVPRVPTILSLCEVDDTCIERLASPLLEQKREASVILAGVHHSQRENSTSHSPHQSEGKLSARHTQSGKGAGTGKVHREDSSPTKEFELKEGK